MLSREREVGHITFSMALAGASRFFQSCFGSPVGKAAGASPGTSMGAGSSTGSGASGNGLATPGTPGGGFMGKLRGLGRATKRMYGENTPGTPTSTQRMPGTATPGPGIPLSTADEGTRIRDAQLVDGLAATFEQVPFQLGDTVSKVGGRQIVKMGLVFDIFLIVMLGKHEMK